MYRCIESGKFVLTSTAASRESVVCIGTLYASVGQKSGFCVIIGASFSTLQAANLDIGLADCYPIHYRGFLRCS
jgi:hypothetical protein